MRLMDQQLDAVAEGRNANVKVGISVRERELDRSQRQFDIFLFHAKFHSVARHLRTKRLTRYAKRYKREMTEDRGLPDKNH